MLKIEYNNLEDIPEQYVELYSNVDGVYRLSQIDGLKTENDIEKIQKALRQSRSEAKKYKEMIEEIKSAPIASEGKDIERDKLIQELQQTQELVMQYKKNEVSRTIADAVRVAAVNEKVVQSAIDDILLLAEKSFHISDNGQIYTNDDNHYTPKEWLSSLENVKPHWWGNSHGGGATGNTGITGNIANNPWSKENFNFTEQNRIYKQNPDMAKQLANLAGSKLLQD